MNCSLKSVAASGRQGSEQSVQNRTPILLEFSCEAAVGGGSGAVERAGRMSSARPRNAVSHSPTEREGRLTATSQALTAKAGRGGWTEVRRSPGNEANGGDAGCVRKLSSSWVAGKWKMKVSGSSGRWRTDPTDVDRTPRRY